jgi:predicted nucleotide-binding protein (sugar kinase/HSP70/actin superfamily)
MRVGIPGGLLYYRYEPFINTFFHDLDINTQYSTKSNKEIVNLGTRHCVDEACFPMKLFHGHVAKLQESCDYVAIPRIMKCEFGESICPKFSGLPELVISGTGKGNNIFSEPIYMNDKLKFKAALKKSSSKIGISSEKFERAFDGALKAQENTEQGIWDTGYKHTVFLAGHPYNIYDSFANMNLIEKLHKMDIGVITEEKVSMQEKQLIQLYSRT